MVVTVKARKAGKISLAMNITMYSIGSAKVTFVLNFGIALDYAKPDSHQERRGDQDHSTSPPSFGNRC